ncbi:hypothetical protein [Acinetobacter stercoris]|uniref:SCP2 domain-containing protein n=1 Tax=Acinetobacter stercoris TaxID=2126983 RepID=A0A2U3N0U5_9GAMM|nr:hypothetical protein [Acinetobacter stercoris]SPL71306.1 hypothetical protein KPC_2484 [Acinetobacter stercoris]
MSETQQQKEQSSLLLNIIMIVFETFYSFILKHDRVVRIQAKKFVDQQITIKMNSYVPYFDFYLQFTDKGLLFDIKAPEKPVDLVVSSTLIDLVQIFLLSNRRSIKKMRLEGDANLKDEFRDLVLNLSAPKLLSDWKNWLSSPDSDRNTIASKKRIQPLLEKIDQQRSQINTLKVEVKQYQNRIRRMEKNQNRLKKVLYVVALLFLVLIVYNLWRLF